MKKILTVGLFFCFLASAGASTQVGEMIVTESSGPNEPDPEKAPAKFNRTLKARMLFREYFSTPSLATPEDEFPNSVGGKSWVPKQTMFFVDGRPVRYHIGARMLTPGTTIYYFVNRRIPQFISIHTHARPISGQLVKKEGDSLVVRRLIGRKFESSGVVYLNQQVKIAANARFSLDGKESNAAECLKEDRLIRVLEAQPLRLSAFTQDALLPHEEFHKIHIGTRAGFLKATDSGQHTIQYLSKSGWEEAKRKGGTGILDGQFMFDNTPVLQPGNQTTAFCFRGSTDKCVFVIGRSNTLGAIDGEIVSLTKDSVTVQVHPGSQERKLPLTSATQCQLNGKGVSVSELKPGMRLTVFEERPQVIDAWSLAPVEVPEDQQVIVYGVDGKKSIAKEGRLPKRLEANQAKEKKN